MGMLFDAFEEPFLHSPRPDPVRRFTARPMPELAFSVPPRSAVRARGSDGLPAPRRTAVGKLLPLLAPPLHRPPLHAGGPAAGGFPARLVQAWRRAAAAL